MINKEFFNGKELLEKYRDTTNPDFVKELSHIYNINNKYQLSPGTENDFNNISNFLKFAITKNSKAIDSYETAFSSMFGGYLKKYFNTALSEDELCDMLSNIGDYNKQIEDEYNINFNPDSKNGIKFTSWKQLIKVLENICGINTENLKIKKNSIAEKIYNIIEKNMNNPDTPLVCGSDLKQNIISILVLYALVSNFIFPYKDYILDDPKNKYTREIKEYILPYLYTQKKSKLGIKNYKIAEREYDRYNISYEFIDPKSNINFHFDVPVRKLEMRIKNKFSDNTINMLIGNCQDVPIAYGPILQNSSVSIFHTFENDEIPNLNVHISDITYTKASIEDPSKVITIIDMSKVINLINSSEGYKIGTNYELGIAAQNPIESIYIKVNNSIVNQIIELYQNDNDKLNTIFKSWTGEITTSKTQINLKINYDLIINKYKSTLASFFHHTGSDNYRYDQYLPTAIVENYPLVSTEYEIMMNTFKIYTEVIASNQINLSLSEIDETNKKMNADSIETYYALSHTNVIPMTFSLYVSEKSPLFGVLKNKFNYPANTGSTIRIGLIYKEFNEYIRDIDMSNIQNRFIGEYITNSKNSIANNKTILNEKLYYSVFSMDYGKDVFDYNERLLFTETKTNDLIIRNSVVNDLISYISGSLINFGDKVSDQTDIQKILKLYKECRDYFYRILYNTSFMLEDTYELYVVLFIKAQTIERFVSSRLDDFLNINNYTEEDCRNFLISYGLKALSDQVDNKNFVNSIEYKKRIIADYNDIMSKKGSRSVIDEFFKIFNYNKNEIEIYKYLIFKDKNGANDEIANDPSNKTKALAMPATNTDQKESYIKFASAPYYSKNIYHDIKYSIDKNTAERYNDFIFNDKYWTKDDLPEEKVKEELVAPVNTKYLGLDLKKDLYYNIISSKYVLSINDYLFQNLFLNGHSSVDNANNSYYTRLYFGNNFQFTLPEIASSSYSFDIGFLYNSMRFLFSVYIYYYENYMKIPNENISLNLPIEKIHYLGINTESRIDDSKLNYSNFIQDLFKTYYAKYDQEKEKFNLNKTNSINFYVNGPKISSFDIEQNDQYYFSKEKLVNTLNNVLSNTKILPVNNILYDKDQKEKILNTSKAKAFDYICRDIHVSNIGKNKNKYLSSKEIIDSAFDSINLINLFNTYNFEKQKNLSNEDEKAERDSYTRMIYYFNKFKEIAAYPKNLNEFGLMANAINDLELKNFYKYLYENIMKFPLDYLLGNHETFINAKYTIDERNLLDKIFNDFFLTNTPIIPITRDTVSHNYNSIFDTPMIFEHKTKKNSVEKIQYLLKVTLLDTYISLIEYAEDGKTILQEISIPNGYLKVSSEGNTISLDSSKINNAFYLQNFELIFTEPNTIQLKLAASANNPTLFSGVWTSKKITITDQNIAKTKLKSNMKLEAAYTLDTSYLDSIIDNMYLSFHAGPQVIEDNKKKLFLETINKMLGDGIIAKIKLNTDSSYAHMFKTYLFGYQTENSSNKETLENTDYKQSIEATNKLIISLTEKLNSVVEGFDNLKMQMETTESVNNFFDFVVTSISFFISYTALLYKTNLIMTIDTKSEKVPIVCGIKDQISNNISEYAYYDESVTIKTILNSGGK